LKTTQCITEVFLKESKVRKRIPTERKRRQNSETRVKEGRLSIIHSQYYR